MNNTKISKEHAYVLDIPHSYTRTSYMYVYRKYEYFILLFNVYVAYSIYYHMIFTFTYYQWRQEGN